MGLPLTCEKDMGADLGTEPGLLFERVIFKMTANHMSEHVEYESGCGIEAGWPFLCFHC
jgi:hypothetical protein